MSKTTNTHDARFRMIGTFQKALIELLRVSLAAALFAQIDQSKIKVLNPHIMGVKGLIGEADLVVLARLNDGRYLLVIWEHKSFMSRLAKLQLVDYVFSKALELMQDDSMTGGKLPLMCGVMALHRDASKYPPKGLDELAGVKEEEREFVMNGVPVLEIDFGKIGLKDLSEDPEEGALILLMTVGWDEREFDDRDLAYLSKAMVVYEEDLSRYIVREVTNVLGVPVERWLAVLARQENQEEAKIAMDVLKEQLKSEGRTEVFLQAAERRFQSVPDHLAAQVHGASTAQIGVWFDRLYEAPDLETVFNGSGNGDASG